MEDKFNFDTWSKNYDKDVKNDKNIFLKYYNVLNFVVKISNVKKSNKVLDIGTGTGNLLLKFLKKGAQVIGLDPSKEMLKIANKKVKDNKNAQLILIENPFLNIPFPKEYFNIVSSTYSFHHVEYNKKEIAIKEMLRVLKNNGILIIGDLMFKNKIEELYFLEKYDFFDKDEYYERIDELYEIFKKFKLSLKQKKFTNYTYIIWCRKS
ncbi:MAG: class I SAM-dependent methyltransferase [Caldisericia bacterium]